MEMMEKISCFPDSMLPRAFVGGLVSNEFKVSVWVEWGCVLTPSIFNPYLHAFVQLPTTEIPMIL